MRTSAAPVDEIERVARVVRASDTRLWLECDAVAGCAACEAGVGCRGGVLAALTGRTRVLEVDRGASLAAPGDRVVLRVPVASVSRAAAIAYGAPLGGLVVGAASPAAIVPGAGDLAAVIGGALGFVLGIALARRWLGARGSQDLRPYVADGHEPAAPR
jgi:positive regulator of sigma E activity